jgi:nucleoredoxin
LSSNFFEPSQILLRKDGSTVLASHALSDAAYVLVYFAAGWCVPCCEFAPLLKTFYEDYHDRKSFEVVLLSFDDSEEAMMDFFVRYHANYCCLPYTDACAMRQMWMQLNDVKGLPSLVVFKNEAPPRTVVTRYGCNMLVSDPTGVLFPWPQNDTLLCDSSEGEVGIAVPPMQLSDAVKPRRSFFDDATQVLLRKDGTSAAATDALGGADYVFVYFSAERCPHCAEFTPVLKAFYEAHHIEKKLEVVLFSLDFSEEEMVEDFKQAHGDYYCLPFNDAQAMQSSWLSLYSVKAIPTVLVFEKGYPRVLLAAHGREMVMKDPTAQYFPWPDTAAVVKAKLVMQLPWCGTGKTHRSECWQLIPFVVALLIFVRVCVLA